MNAGEIDFVGLPQFVAEYVINVTGSYEIFRISITPASELAFGFRNDDAGKSLAEKFNGAIRSMKDDGTLAILKEKYIENAGSQEPEAVSFSKFDDGEKIVVAVTGDLPPVDYVTADGKAAGFNTAVIAEISR